MPSSILITRDFDQVSQVASSLVEADIAAGSPPGQDYVLGLATGSSPSGLYKHLAKAMNAGRVDASRIRTFNLDEYVGLPGRHAQERILHPESYAFYMIAEFFGLVRGRLIGTHLPAAALIDQPSLERALRRAPDAAYTLRGRGPGKAIHIASQATGLLRSIKQDVLDAYHTQIKRAGGIDLQVIGVGGRGHVAFHESGIPFDAGRTLLVRLDDNTLENALRDGHFPSKEQCPRYAVSMGIEQIFEARSVLLVAHGIRKARPVADALLGKITCRLPLSYSRRYAAGGGRMLYVLDEAAASDILPHLDALREQGHVIEDLRGQPAVRLQTIAFTYDPATRRIG